MNAFAPLRHLLKLTALQSAQGFAARRWFLLPVAFALLTIAIKSLKGFDYTRQVPVELNFWDVLPCMLGHLYILLWVFVLGFALLVGDGLAHARVSGAAAMSLIRASSRTGWWLARVLAKGFQAFCFVAASTAVTLIMSALVLPLSLEPSPAAGLLTGNAVLYPRWPSLSMPAFTLVIATRAAFGLWIVGCFLELVSLVFRHPAAPLAAVMGWISLSLGVFSRLGPGDGPARWLDLAQLVSYVAHLEPHGPSIEAFLFGWAVMLLSLFLLGALRLRHLDF
jgi:hypothetical protein